MMRLPAAHRCPALLNAEPIVHVTAFFRSASSQTMSGFLPPSSRQTFASRRPAVSAIQRPTSHEPVKLTTATSGCSTSGAPGFLAEAVQRRVHPVGHACFAGEHAEGPRGQRCVLGRLEDRGVAAQQRRKRLPGDVGDRRVRRDDQSGHTQRLPHDHRRLVRHRARRRLAVETAALAGDEEAHLDRRVGFAERVLARLAGFPARRGPRSAARCSRIRIAIWRRMSPRLTTVVAAHAGCAFFAISTASFTSAAVDRATWQISRPVAGSILANVRPSPAAASWPPS